MFEYNLRNINSSNIWDVINNMKDWEIVVWNLDESGKIPDRINGILEWKKLRQIGWNIYIADNKENRWPRKVEKKEKVEKDFSKNPFVKLQDKYYEKYETIDTIYDWKNIVSETKEIVKNILESEEFKKDLNILYKGNFDKLSQDFVFEILHLWILQMLVWEIWKKAERKDLNKFIKTLLKSSEKMSVFLAEYLEFIAKEQAKKEKSDFEVKLEK